MNIAFYLRLSLSDGDLGKNNKDESNSIENQRLLLQSFVESMDELDGEVREYIDDGYSGTNFNRPAFQDMIEDAKKGKVDVLLVKDLSRLGTGYREEDMIYRLLALEDYFPEMKLERNSQTGDVTINLHNKKLNDFLFTWGVIRGKRAKGLISEEEYLNWKYKLQIV